MRSKDMLHILFLLTILTVVCGCQASKGEDSAVRIYIGGRINGKILSVEEKIGGIQGTLPRLGGMIQDQMKTESMPTVMIQAGNSIKISSEGSLLKAKLLSEGIKLIGFGANLASDYEFEDTPEYANKRLSFGWPQVVSNIEKKEGSSTDLKFEKYYMADPKTGRLVYFLNFIAKPTWFKYPLLKDNFDWVEPADTLKRFVKTIRPRDILIINYQTNSASDLSAIYDIPEGNRISLFIINEKLFGKIGQPSRRPVELKNANIVNVPQNVSNIIAVRLWWDPWLEQWRMNDHQLQVGLNYPKDQRISELLDKRTSEVVAATRKENFAEKIASFKPEQGGSNQATVSSTCASCHPDAFDVWKKSAHAKIEVGLTCDGCHKAGFPHIQFENWFASLNEELQKLALEIQPDRLTGKKPVKEFCMSCHKDPFDFDTEWLKIKHSSTVTPKPEPANPKPELKKPKPVANKAKPK